MSVLFMVAVLILVLLCSVGWGCVIDGKWDFMRNSSVSRPGFVVVPSGFSGTPRVLLFFLSLVKAVSFVLFYFLLEYEFP